MMTLDNAARNKIQVIRVSEALDLLRRTERIALIDVRDRKTYVDDHPVFSINAPIDSLEEKWEQRLIHNEIFFALRRLLSSLHQ